MWREITSWWVVGIVVPTCIAVAVGVMSMSPPEFLVAKTCFVFAGVILGLKVASWLIHYKSPVWKRIALAMLVFGLTAMLLVQSWQWVNRRQEILAQSSKQKTATQGQNPDKTFTSKHRLVLEWAVSRNTRYAYVQIDTGALEPWKQDFNVMVIVRVVDDMTDALKDPILSKSEAFAITGEIRKLGVNLTGDFIKKADASYARFHEVKLGYHLVIMPKNVSPERIKVLADVWSLGGRVLQETVQANRSDTP